VVRADQCDTQEPAMRHGRRATNVAIAAFAGLLAASAVAADLPRARPEAVGMSAERLQRVSAYAAQLIATKQAAGVVTLIARRGRIVHLEATGMADIENDEPMTTDAYFRLYSMTKPITSVALLILYEEGKFQLSDPLAKYLPEFAGIRVMVEGGSGDTTVDAERPPTIADVFRHTAGFSYDGDLYDSPSLEELNKRLAARPLSYQPGTRWVYSFAHDVQARLVEVLSGSSFESFVRSRILEPLGMTNVVVGIPASLASRFPVTYGPAEGGGLMIGDVAEQTNYQQVPFGGTSLAGPVLDYVRFAQMLANSGELDGVRILSPKTVDLMATDHLPRGVTFAPGEGYGLGVRVVVDPVAAGNLPSPGTFGWSGAASTHFIVDREEGLVALLMYQYQPRDTRPRDEFETLVYQSIVD
jgi:CubicO group peptidase (beta-lactamase class C family)